jgi:hypothetical protein
MCDFRDLSIVKARWKRREPALTGKVTSHSPKSMLFVYLGNICRSPTAEVVFRKLVSDQNVWENWREDSAATSTYEVGTPRLWRAELHEEAPHESRCPAGYQRLPHSLTCWVWINAIGEIWKEKGIELKTAKLKLKSNYSGTVTHKNNSLLRTPIMGTTHASRPPVLQSPPGECLPPACYLPPVLCPSMVAFLNPKPHLFLQPT